MKKLALHVIFILMTSTIYMFAEGEEGIDTTVADNRQTFEQQHGYKLFFHEHQLQNLDALRHTYQQEHKKGLEGLGPITRIKTYLDHITLFGRKKGPLATVQDAFKNNVSLNDSNFLFSRNEENAFNDLDPQKQLAFINQFDKQLEQIAKKKIATEKQILKMKLDKLNQEKEKLQNEKEGLEGKKWYSFKHFFKLPNHKRALIAKIDDKITGIENEIKYEIDQTQKNITVINKIYTNKLINLANKLNSFIDRSAHIKFNMTQNKFEFHKINIIPQESSVSNSIRPSINQPAFANRSEFGPSVVRNQNILAQPPVRPQSENQVTNNNQTVFRNSALRNKEAAQTPT